MARPPGIWEHALHIHRVYKPGPTSNVGGNLSAAASRYPRQPVADRPIRLGRWNKKHR